MSWFRINVFKAWLNDASCVVIEYNNKRIEVNPKEVIDKLREIFYDLRGVFVQSGKILESSY